MIKKKPNKSTTSKIKPKFKRKHKKKHKGNPKGRVKNHAKQASDIMDGVVEAALVDKDLDEIDLTVVEREKERARMLQMEWAIFYPNEKISTFVREIKGYSDGQYKRVLALCPASSWDAQREMLKNRISKEVATRHIDKIATMNDEHIKAGRLGLAKGLQLLANGVEGIVKKTGKAFKRNLYPQEFHFVMSGLKTAQQMYRTSMGLPSDGEGMRQVVEELAKRDRQIQQNIQINIKTEAPKGPPKPDKSGITELKKLMDDLTYDEVKLFVQRKREALKTVSEPKKE